MPNSVIVQGYEQIQAANRKLLQAMLPSGALGKAVLYGTQQMQKGTTARAHVDTGTYKASQTADVHGLIGRVYTASNRNPKSGAAASAYGPYEEARGGSHAAYATTFSQDAPGVMVEAIKLVIAELP
jgi:hypothetical protein